MLKHAQADMRHAYYSGGAGILASALAWSAAAGTAALVSPERAIWVLLAGGVLIHPAAVLICRMLGASAFVVAAIGAALEAVFAIVCLVQHRRWIRHGDVPPPTL
jgi:hypothetical protein